MGNLLDWYSFVGLRRSCRSFLECAHTESFAPVCMRRLGYAASAEHSWPALLVLRWYQFLSVQVHPFQAVEYPLRLSICDCCPVCLLPPRRLVPARTLKCTVKSHGPRKYESAG